MQKIIPPYLFVICSVLMLGLWWLYPMYLWLSFPISLIGLLPFIVGLGIAKQGSDVFAKTGTNIETFHDPNVLVTEGLYKISRNPMYLGFLTALLGIALILGNASALLIVISFFVITDRWYIEFEEHAMEKTFGDAYRHYKTQTRRWL